jgi:hypothetical protein
MAAIGTFETCRPALTMSVSRGRPEVVGRNPISLLGGNQLATLEDAARLIQRLPKAEQRRNSSASALTIP